MLPLNPQHSGNGIEQLLPILRRGADLVDSPISSEDPSASSYSSLSSSTSNYPALTPKRSGVVSSATPSLSRSTTSSTIPVVASLPPSPVRRQLQPSSSFISTPGLKTDSAASGVTDSVKFVDEVGVAARASQRHGSRANPVWVVSGIQGTVLPEHHGGLPKMGHTAVSYQQGVYVFGGVNAKGQYSNHVFCHEKRSLTWHEIRGVGVVPRGRANHAAVLVDAKIYVFGGHRQLEVFDDLFTYDIATSKWERLSYEQSQGPGGVFLHCMIHIPSSESLFVLGGVHHREQNSYLGHLFDIRNRVWSGVPPPPAVNPQHLQLVTAAYHEPSNNVVVLGLAEDKAKQHDAVTVPHVYLFDPQVFAWRRVETLTAPESPLSFRVEALWEHFLHFLITSGGGLYDPVLQNWMFPFPLSGSSGRAAERTTHGKQTQNPPMPSPLPTNKIVFLVLNVHEMSWSLVQCKFLRKLLAEVKMFNMAERQKMERSAPHTNGISGPLTALTHRSSSSSSVRQGRNESGVLNVSGLSRATGGNGHSGGGGVFGQRPHKRNLSTPLSAGVTWDDGDSNSEFGSGTAVSARRGSGTFTVDCTSDRYRRLVNFEDVPEFTRKFVLVAVRDAPLKNGKLRPMQYMVLHGGLLEPTDYTMLAFKPKLTSLDTLKATKQNGQLAGLVRTASYRTLRATRNTTVSNSDLGSGDSDDGDGEGSNYRGYSTSINAEPIKEVFPSSTTGANGAHKKPGDTRGMSFVSLDDGDNDGEGDVFLQAFRTSVSDEEIAHQLGDLDGDPEARSHHTTSLLPTLPRGRSTGNSNRFALQYSAQNALYSESFLPYANIPVAVLQNAHDVQKWSKNYYDDQRRWLSKKLKDALTEDRKLRRLRRVANARGGRRTSSGGSIPGVFSSRNSALSDDLSLADTDSLFESLCLLESVANLPRIWRSGEKSSIMQTFEDQLTIEAAAAVVENKEAPKRRVQDFFEERRLEPFVAEEVAQAPQLNYNASTSLDDRAHQKKLKKKQSTAGDAAKSKSAKRAPATDTSTSVGAVGKKQGFKTTTTTPAAAQSILTAVPIKPTALSTSFASIVGRSTAARVGFERFNLRPRRHDSPGARTSRNSDAGHNHLARSVSQLLLQNRLSRFRAGDDSFETRRKKAQLRWRFLRALVRTGEASYLMFVASQAQSKMKGVPVSSTPGLVLAPELHLVGPSQAYKVPSRPVPYNVSNTGGAYAKPPSVSPARLTQVTNSGMVVYRSLR